MDLLFKEEVYAIVGAAIEVHRTLGSGFLEPVYQEGMEIEVDSGAIAYQPQFELPLRYKGPLMRKPYCADFICYGKIIVELKALSRMSVMRKLK
ncbi:MAG TPA: GxxExxY protein [Tepidisphaeraceae bacterium]|jgi:GxxExxY protein|nr:GxxExxY protein [Tepidisphaeraceae bacterium]